LSLARDLPLITPAEYPVGVFLICLGPEYGVAGEVAEEKLRLIYQEHGDVAAVTRTAKSLRMAD